jgi:phosphate-selective porin OprO/OprP
MSGKTRLLAGAAASVTFMLAGAAAFAEDGAAKGSAKPASSSAAPTNEQLEKEIEAIKAQLSKNSATDSSLRSRLSALEQNFNDVTWTFNNGRPQIQTADGRFQMALRGRFQVDFADWFQDSPGSLPAGAVKDLGNGAVIRRAYFGIEGKVFNDFWYEYRFNFGGSNIESGTGAADPNLNIARIMYTGVPDWQFNVGVIEPVQTEGLSVSSGGLLFVERPEIDNIIADTFGGGDSRRGVEVRYQKSDVFYPGTNIIVTGSFTGDKTASSTGHAPGGDEPTQAFGRVALRLWSDGTSNFQLGGGGGELVHRSPTIGGLQLRDRPELRVDGSRLIDTGAIANIDGGSYYVADAEGNWKSLYLGAEYSKITLNRVGAADPEFSGWYVEGSWVLTGETKTYTASALNNELGSWAIPAPSRPFSLRGHSWGALEVAVRYSDTDLSDGASGILGGEEKIISGGVNWYLNRNVRAQLDYLNIDVNKPNASQTVNALGGMLQFQF